MESTQLLLLETRQITITQVIITASIVICFFLLSFLLKNYEAESAISLFLGSCVLVGASVVFLVIEGRNDIIKHKNNELLFKVVTQHEKQLERDLEIFNSRTINKEPAENIIGIIVKKQHGFENKLKVFTVKNCSIETYRIPYIDIDLLKEALETKKVIPYSRAVNHKEYVL